MVVGLGSAGLGSATVKPPAELTALFRAQGRNVTPQRRRIFEVLHGNDVHPTAEAVHQAVRVDLPTISLRTVYQTLNDLASMGEIQHLEFGTGSGRFDPNIDPHHHLVCDACGSITDVSADTAHLPVPAEATPGFTVRATEIVFRGRCQACESVAGREDVAALT